MKTFKHPGYRKLMALAILAAFGPAHAADDEVADLTQPGSSVGVGVGVTNGDSKDRSLFGQYNGLRDHDGNLLLDLDLVKRDDATGTWMILKGRNLGLDNRELGATYEKQGDWRVSAGYNEITKHEIRTVNTGMTGAGTTTPVINLLPTIRTGSDVDLTLERKGFTLGGEKWLTKNLLLEIDFKNEDKDGARLFGKGFTCSSTAVAAAICPGGAGVASWGTLLLPEPINSTTRQFEAKLNWSGEKFLVSGGYYGSFYQNSNFALTPTLPAALVNTGGGPLAQPAQAGLLAILAMPVALPPDNQAHQFYLAGNYDFTLKTKATFKVAYTHATQDEGFGIFTAAAPAGRTSLDGEINTTMLQLGVSSRPLPKLALAANVKYEKTDDKTPLAYYNSITNGLVNTVFTNDHLNREKLDGKLEAGYQFLPSTRGTLGVDYKTVKRDLPVSTTVLGGLSALREDTDEIAYRAEVRQTFSDSLSGSFGYSTGQVRGGDWYNVATRTVVPASTLALTSTWPLTLMDRNREKFRLTADWTPADKFSLQFSAEDGKDHNVMPGDVNAGRGNRGVEMNLYSLDATWVLSRKLRMTVFASTGTQDYRVNHGTGGYIMDVASDSDDFGIGLVYQPAAAWQLGADYSYHNDKDQYRQAQAGAITTGGLPDVTFRLSTLKLYGQYELDKRSAIRVDLVNQEAKLHEWTWDGIGQPYFYSDRTTVSMKPDQKVTFLGARYIYKFR